MDNPAEDGDGTSDGHFRSAYWVDCRIYFCADANIMGTFPRFMREIGCATRGRHVCHACRDWLCRPGRFFSSNPACLNDVVGCHAGIDGLSADEWPGYTQYCIVVGPVVRSACHIVRQFLAVIHGRRLDIFCVAGHLPASVPVDQLDQTTIRH